MCKNILEGFLLPLKLCNMLNWRLISMQAAWHEIPLKGLWFSNAVMTS